jgi:hypothetical protein
LNNEHSIQIQESSVVNERSNKVRSLSIRGFLLALAALFFIQLSPIASASNQYRAMDIKIPTGPKLKLDDERWVSLGMGYRGSGNWNDMSGTSPGVAYTTDNARLYVNGQVHKYLKFEFNTECFHCNSKNGQVLYTVLDAIGKVEYNRYLNFWGGRMLVPTERGELSGPFFQATHDAFRTPFFPQDQSGHFGTGGAGRYGRDDGGTFFGNAEPGFIKGTLGYAGGIYRGASANGTGGPEGPSIAGRITYNFWNPEKNPGYYTSSTYFGKAGDILAVAVGSNYQHNGAGSTNVRSDFLGAVADVLMEKVLPNNLGVLTVNGEYKRFYAGYDKVAAATDIGTNPQFGGGCNTCVFAGQSWSVTGLHLLPTKIGIGQLQPYGRYTSIQPDATKNRTEVEAGVNYIVDGFNGRISAFWRRGDISSNFANYTPGSANGTVQDEFRLAFQIQM